MVRSKAEGDGLQQALFLKVDGTGIGVSQGGIKIVGAQQTREDTTRGGEGVLLMGIDGGEGKRKVIKQGVLA